MLVAKKPRLNELKTLTGSASCDRLRPTFSIADDTSTAVTCPKRRAAARAKVHVPALRSTTIEVGPKPCVTSNLQVGGEVRTPLLVVVARDKGRVKVFRAGVIQFIVIQVPLMRRLSIRCVFCFLGRTASRGGPTKGGAVTDCALESESRPPRGEVCGYAFGDA